MFIDISLGENFLPHMGELVMDYTMNGRVATSPGNRDDSGLLVQGAYPCAWDDEWIAISIGKIEQWHILCRLMGKPELTEDPRFGDMNGLRTHHNEVDQIIGEWTANQEPISLFHHLQKESIIAGPVLHEEHTYADPHLKERGFFASVTHPEIGTHLYPGTTYKLCKIPFEVRKPAVRLGEDNDYVYREVLGFSEEGYDVLKGLGQIGMDFAPHVQ
jgi:crotonobetainyl-CoA:carnitine CoA-transferase CaiB-like acyl-CoA transferase